MLDREADVGVEQAIRFRIGVNLGDIIIDAQDIFGDGVNVAARLEALAEPGGVCISGTVRDHIADKLPYPFDDKGEQRLKNIARPVSVCLMSPAAVAATSLVAVRQTPRRPLFIRRQTPTNRPRIAGTAVAPRLSIVVLPFANLSNDPEQEYFADGITDDLTTDLSRIQDSFVIARTTAFIFKGKAVDVKQIGHELGVRYVLEGSVRRSGARVRVNVQLSDTETGAQLWADRFDTDCANFVAAQDEITSRLARTLNLALVQAAGRRIENEAAVSIDARDLTMRGFATFNRLRSPAIFQEAQRFFERALSVDPGSIDARIGIATMLARKMSEGWSALPNLDGARAEQLLLEALDRDPNRSTAHHAMGLLRRSQTGWAKPKSSSRQKSRLTAILHADSASSGSY